MKMKMFLFLFLKLIITCILGGVYAQLQFIWKDIYPPIDFLILVFVVFAMINWRLKNSKRMNIYISVVYGLLVTIIFSISNAFFYACRIF